MTASTRTTKRRSASFFVRPFEARDVAAVQALFTAYYEWLNVDLSYQNYTTEFSSLPGAYDVQRKGALLLAVRRSEAEGQEQYLGCVALRQLVNKDSSDAEAVLSSNATDSSRCEMKRLFVTPQARGLGVGQALVTAIIERARTYGYARCFLDTLPHMHEALLLYRRAGFVEVDAYYDTPLRDTVFLMAYLNT